MQSSKDVLKDAGAVLTSGHFVYTSGKHGSEYVNKDAVYPNPDHVNQIARNIVDWVLGQGMEVEVVVAPAIGAVKLEKAVTEELRRRTGQDILGIYAEQEQEAIVFANSPCQVYIDGSEDPILLEPGAELFIKLPKMIIKRGYDKLVPGKKVLVVEDVLTTGQSAERTVDAVRRYGGNVVAVAAICNRGGVSAHDLGVDILHSEIEVVIEMYDPNKCPLCASKVPINTQYGHGKKFLAEQAK